MDGSDIRNTELLAAALEGLQATPKSMNPKWFYDEKGSLLFEKITDLPEYYPTRTEVGILRDRIDDIAAHVPDDAELVELGSGASTKTRLLLDRLRLTAYRPLDISGEFLEATAARLRESYPVLGVAPIVGDFTQDMTLPNTDSARVAFFPGSTLGNLEPDAAAALLRRVRDWPGIAAFVLGVDLVKDQRTLVAAYDDAEGVTAAFNLNLLERLNREAGANFNLDRFAHRAIWNADKARIEMHLESLADQTVTLDGTRIAFEKGETIHTESSHKFTRESLSRIAGQGGWQVAELVTDPAELFAVAILTPVPA
ncbi:L-histidine N(alpha)-methyltransferase [Palleronia abyssalis]|uniref:Histidine N-alpha-methyltransferase n=1 Tax=Palleronia abyssalis TaxID=1501240 RepID=A0A2R8BXT7_9RHOB|nr:L-histidine N(alpha)-methyltransferase [Palleronia abyssalis]SPJ24886.1 Histidine N-alpha-methyltransferase [Palleronia abyssalis]